MNFFFRFLLFSIIALISINSSAQVTIGSAYDPVEGSLLDIKENEDGTSKRGMMLPRVELQDINQLIMGSTDYTGKELEYIGLTVFNVNEIGCMAAGVYVWNGSQWIQLSGEEKSTIEAEGSYESDIAALKEIYNSNPDNTLTWDFNNNLDDVYEGVTWAQSCNTKRVVRLSLFAKKITSSQGIDKLYALNGLDCGINNISSFDLSKLTNLEIFSCSSNNVSNLDVSNLTKLVTLWCGGNKLTNIDLSHQTDLKTLYCYDNQITNLELSHLVTLKELRCSQNPLGSLDLSNLNLVELVCAENSLSSLDLSQQTNLTSLNCSTNLYASLDLSNQTKLEYLYCYSNAQLTSLNLTGCTALKYIDVYRNNLTSIDLSGFPNLYHLECSSNPLTSLDVSSLVNLTYLNCSRLGGITELDVTNLVKLERLSCVVNKIAKLDLLNLTELTQLTCSFNALTELNVSNSPKLTSLDCSYNQFSQEEVNQIALHSNYCLPSSKFVILPNSRGPALTLPSCP